MMYMVGAHRMRVRVPDTNELTLVMYRQNKCK